MRRGLTPAGRVVAAAATGLGLTLLVLLASRADRAAVTGSDAPLRWWPGVTLGVVVLVVTPYVLAQVVLAARAADELGDGPRRFRRWWAPVGAFVFVAVLVAVRWLLGDAGDVDFGGAAPGGPAVPETGGGGDRDVVLAPPWLVAVAAAVATAVAVALRPRDRAPAGDQDLGRGPQDPLDRAAEAARLELDVEGPDPRAAVVAAYARMETVFAGEGIPRRPSETAAEYVDRLLRRHGAPAPAVTRLRSLYNRARFAPDPVDERMRSDARDALRRVVATSDRGAS